MLLCAPECVNFYELRSCANYVDYVLFILIRLLVDTIVGLLGVVSVDF